MSLCVAGCRCSVPLQLQMTTSRTSQQIIMGALGLTLGLGGCAASRTTTRAEASDLRGTTRVATPAPAFLVAGPVELLHVNVDKKAGARFIRVPHHEGAVVD